MDARQVESEMTFMDSLGLAQSIENLWILASNVPHPLLMPLLTPSTVPRFHV